MCDRFLVRRVIPVAVVVLTAALLPLLPPGPLAPSAAAARAAGFVEPVRWAGFTRGAPDGPDVRRIRNILLNTNRYALLTWFPETYGAQEGDHLEFEGTGEADIRPPASEAFALATSLRLGVYDEARVGVSAQRAREVTLRLVASLAYRHTATTPGGWGDHWQSALWAFWAGSAGWLLWEDLDPTQREMVAAMVEHEADRFLGYEVPYYRNAAGEVVRPGDSKAEENAWNALVLQLATAMMPEHPHRSGWMHTCLKLMISSFARPQDVRSNEIVNGRPLHAWLDGSNANRDGTVVNHGLLHPDYMTPVQFNVTAVQSYTLAGMPTPEAAFFNADVVYDAFVDLVFPSPPYRTPGGTIYVDGSRDIYYPEGNDWGTHRRMPFAWLDVQARAFGFDRFASTPATTWERLHAQMVLDMQRRFPDRRTFGDWSEMKYAGREQYVAVQAAHAYLVKWLDHQGSVRVTERAYPQRWLDVSTGGPALASAGTARELTVEVTGASRGSLSGRVTVEAPPGWGVEPRVRRFRLDGRHESLSRRLSFDLTVPPNAEAGEYLIRVSARAGERTTGTRTSVFVIGDPVPVGVTSAYNADIVSTDADRGDGDIGSGYTYPAEELPAAGRVVLSGVPFLFPGAEDGEDNAIRARGQLIDLPDGRYTHAVILGTSVYGSSDAPATVTYADGTTSEVRLRFSDWTFTKPLRFEEHVAVETTHVHHRTRGDVALDARILAQVVRLDATREAGFIRLPKQERLYVFAPTLGAAE